MANKKPCPKVSYAFSIYSIARAMCGITQSVIAEECHVDQMTVSRFERGLTARPDLEEYYEKKFRISQLREYEEVVNWLNGKKTENTGSAENS